MPHDVIGTLNSLIAERSLLRHPFYQAWTAGTLPIERLRNYAIRYYPHVEAFPRYLSTLHSRCQDMTTRQALLENLIEEERGTDNHPELWLRFAQALGVPRESIVGAAAVPAAENLVDTYLDLAASEPLQAGLSALYVYEAQIPAVAAAKIDGLKRFYGINDGNGLAFFSVHEKADIWHAQTGARLIEQHCRTEQDGEVAIGAATRALDALWSMLDAV
jgi:pyrroloquinoline-quinone synthase